MKSFKQTKDELPVSVVTGLHISCEKHSRIYGLLSAVVALCGLFGSLFTFITACESKGGSFISHSFAALSALVCFVVFSAVFLLADRFPKAYRICTVLLLAGLCIYIAADFPVIVRGFRYLINGFMGCAFSQYADTPYYFLSEFFYLDGKYYSNEYCAERASFCVIAVMAMGLCSFIRVPNILIFTCSAFLLPELCLYFGMVPSHLPFALLCASLCGAAAGDISRLGSFSGSGTERAFERSSVQSAVTAALLFLCAFGTARLYANASEFSRPDSIREFRNGVVYYMNDFSWEKLANDIKINLFPQKDSSLTHDGKLGNTESVEFSGKNMLEVTLPSDCDGIYLKGFTGVDYTSSGWESGMPVPKLVSDMTSPEFLSGRILKYFPNYGSMRSKDVIIRNVGISPSVKYFPEGGAGLLETDGVRRRYGVYFPEKGWRSTVISGADSISPKEELAADELTMREYAYNYCLDVPEVFTAHEEFFAEFEGGGRAETLSYIRSGLAQRCSYDLESGKKPLGKDFAQWFLTEGKRGSCTHFATAAVLLCRSIGIPARYCEGFVVKSEDIADFPENDGYTTVSVPDNRAHAWAEVYIDGYGWLCFEATPGYGNMAMGSVDPDGSEENAEYSEITSVTTAAPVFTENPVSSKLAAEETEITVTSVSEETTVISTDIAESSIYESSSAASETGDISGVSETSYIGEGYEAVTTITAVTGQALGESVSDSSETEGTTVTSEEAQEFISGGDSEKLSPAVFLWLGAAVVIIGSLPASRALRFRYRRKLAVKCPDKAAAMVYRAVIRASGEENIPDTLCRRLSEMGIDEKDSRCVVMTAMKARFGGGISREELRESIECAERILEEIHGGKNAFARAAAFISGLDRYLSGDGENGKDS
ncbi:MAG: transglutaminase domain-containing protein [Oscillospiraceae bacterium]|nr:transglutaminase domain-containing protein [Oscillospiraceae bacterium]